MSRLIRYFLALLKPAPSLTIHLRFNLIAQETNGKPEHIATAPTEIDLLPAWKQISTWCVVGAVVDAENWSVGEKKGDVQSVQNLAKWAQKNLKYGSSLLLLEFLIHTIFSPFRFSCSNWRA
jgi:hypothetical protein